MKMISEFRSPEIENNFVVNSFAVNIHGDLFFLTEEGDIHFINLKQINENNTPCSLLLENREEMYDMSITNIEFNQCGSILLVWGSKCLGMIVLSDITRDKSSHANSPTFKLLYRSENSETDLIARVRWHPMSDQHIAVLLKEDIFFVIDCILDSIQEYPLRSFVTYSSFCFGPNIDWMRCAIFLLQENGSVSVLCPVVPYGAVFSSSAVNEMKAWLADQDPNVLYHNGRLTAYEELVSSYLQSAFGVIQSHRDGDNMSVYRAGVNQHHSLHKYFNLLPELQGPVEVEGRKIKVSSSRDSKVIASDIAHPSSSALGGETDAYESPTLVIAWSTGHVEQIIISQQVGRPFVACMHVCTHASNGLLFVLPWLGVSRVDLPPTQQHLL